jgi:hypothetical protein
MVGWKWKIVYRFVYALSVMCVQSTHCYVYSKEWNICCPSIGVMCVSELLLILNTLYFLHSCIDLQFFLCIYLQPAIILCRGPSVNIVSILLAAHTDSSSTNLSVGYLLVANSIYCWHSQRQRCKYCTWTNWWGTLSNVSLDFVKPIRLTQ